jgi:acyl-CoA dehydrogenase
VNTDSIYFGEELRMFRDQVRRFVEHEVVPHGAAWETAGEVPRAVLRRMGELGMLGVTYPTEYGGAGLDTLATVVLAEELGRSTFGGFAVTVLVHTDMASPHIARYGSPAQRDRYLPSIIRGEAITAVAVTEADAGSDVASIRTRAERTDPGYVLNGQKMFVTNGVCADIYCVAARTDPHAKPSRGISMFLVERGTPGLTVSRALHKTGWLASDTAELAFADCEIGADQLLGEEHHGFYAVMRNFQNERLALAGMAMGEARKALDVTTDYVGTRRAFGGVLYDKQVVRQRLAMRTAEVQAARQLLYHAAWLDARGYECVTEVAMTKAVCGELVNRVLYDCVQFHGGAGYLRESVIERMARDARVHTIGGGATEVMLDEIAKRMGPRTD